MICQSGFVSPGGSIGLAHALHAALGVGERAVLLRVQGRGQEHVGVLGRLGHEDVLDHEEVEVLQRLAHVVGVGVGERRVLAHDEHRLERAVHGEVEHLRDAQAHVLRHLHSVGLGELLLRLEVEHARVARERVGQRAHVARALHVVLAAHGVHAGVGHADVAGDHAEVGEVHDVGRADGVLGDAERVEDAGLGRRRVQLRRRDDGLGRHPGDLSRALRRVVLDGLPEGVEALGALVDVGLVVPAVADDRVQHAVDERVVRARLELQPEVRVLGELGAPRVDDDELGAAQMRLLHLVADDRVRLGGVGPDDEEHVVADDLADRVGHRA